jgi:outer membrane protein assembly factor BamB
MLPVAAAVLLAGCAGGMDSLSSMNPFASKPEVMPANARPVFEDADPANGVVNAKASVGAPSPASDWTQAGGSATNDPGNIAGRLAGERFWSLRAGASGYGREMFGLSSSRGRAVAARPVAADGTVYILDADGVVSGYKIANGGSTWHINAYKPGDRVVGGGLAVGGGRVVASTGPGEVVAIDAATSSVAWRGRLDAPALSAPAIGGGKVVVVSQAGTVQSFDLSTGNAGWKAATDVATTALLGSMSVAIAGDTVVVPGTSGDLFAFDLATGARKWQITVGGSTAISAASGLGSAAASPVVHGDTIYATGFGGSLAAISLKTGDIVWKLGLGSTGTPVVSGDSVFLIDVKSRMIAVDRNKGKVLWSQAMPPLAGSTAARATWAGPVLIGGKLWASSGDGRVAAVDAVTGTLGPVTTIGFNGAIAPIAASGKLMVLSGDGYLIAVK